MDRRSQRKYTDHTRKAKDVDAETVLISGSGADARSDRPCEIVNPMEPVPTQPQLWQFGHVDPAVVLLPLDDLNLNISPRSSGEDKLHTKMMATSECELPPIIVHRSTMSVIDGVHRLSAAKIRRESTIRARFFDGTIEDAFALAVAANVQHGKPLSLKDRKAAATRILATSPDWSDRRIASISGVSHRTVAGIRRHLLGGNDGLSSRIGRDGKVRPVRSEERRQAAAEAIRQDSSASLREIARLASVSPGTVRNVRERLLDELPDEVRPAAARHNPEVSMSASRTREDLQAHEPGDTQPMLVKLRSDAQRAESLLHRLRSDPALRFNESGRVLVRLLTVANMGAEKCELLASGVPEHCRPMIAGLAAIIADSWTAAAINLEADQHGDQPVSGSSSG